MNRTSRAWGRRLAVLGGAPALAVVLASSVAWACVSHTGPGAFHQRVVNLTGVQQGRVTTNLNQDNIGGSGCTVGVPFQVCIPQANILLGAGIKTGDSMLSEVDGIPSGNQATLVQDLTGTYRVRITDQANCFAWSGGADFISPVPGPNFAVNWTVPTVVAATLYYACVLDPIGPVPVDPGNNGGGAKVTLVGI